MIAKILLEHKILLKYQINRAIGKGDTRGVAGPLSPSPSRLTYYKIYSFNLHLVLKHILHSEDDFFQILLFTLLFLKYVQCTFFMKLQNRNIEWARVDGYLLIYCR